MTGLRTSSQTFVQSEAAHYKLQHDLTGLRIGEFLSLTKFSLDLSSQILTGGSKMAAGQDRVI